jgi:hypothetical protein
MKYQLVKVKKYISRKSSGLNYFLIGFLIGVVFTVFFMVKFCIFK